MSTHTEDRVGRMEALGIEVVPDSARHGGAAQLFAVWASSAVNYLGIVLGGVLILLGLQVWQALVVVVLGNLFWAAIGLIAIAGPASGTPSSVITRSQFGVLGNRFYLGLLSWPVFIAYEAVNLALGALAGFAFAHQVGVDPGRPVQVLVVVLTAVVTLVISIYGHATIVRMSTAFTVGLSAAMLVLGVLVVAHAHWGYHPAAGSELTGWAVPAAMMAGVTLIASVPLSWGISPDYARYLPRDSSPLAVAGWTALGGFVPSVLLGAVGVLAGTAVDMTDPQSALAAIVPDWFYPVLLLVIVVGSMANNVLTMYSSGLCLQAVGIRAPRSVTVLADGLLGVALACYALFVSDVTDTLSSVLQATVALVGPAIGIFCVDIALRRNRYDGHELHDERPGGAFWFSGGVNRAGIAALVVATGLAVLCLDTSEYVGPLARHLDGADLSSIVGPVVGGVLYLVLVRVLHPAHVVRTPPPTRPGQPVGSAVETPAGSGADPAAYAVTSVMTGSAS